MEELIPFGFYICKATEHHPLSNCELDKMISASDCLCDHEPQLSLCHGWEPHGDDADYISRFHSKDEYLKMSEEINSLFSSGDFFGDGRFIRLEDALHFFDLYFQKCILISVSTSPEYLILNDDLKYYGKDDVCNYESIGMDIIGLDMGLGFHSFLCNGLQYEFSDIGFNKYGFMEMDFKKASLIAELIQGMGEPVDWFPVEVRRIR